MLLRIVWFGSSVNDWNIIVIFWCWILCSFGVDIGVMLWFLSMICLDVGLIKWFSSWMSVDFLEFDSFMIMKILLVCMFRFMLLIVIMLLVFVKILLWLMLCFIILIVCLGFGLKIFDRCLMVRMLVLVVIFDWVIDGVLLVWIVLGGSRLFGVNVRFGVILLF